MFLGNIDPVVQVGGGRCSMATLRTPLCRPMVKINSNVIVREVGFYCPVSLEEWW